MGRRPSCDLPFRPAAAAAGHHRSPLLPVDPALRSREQEGCQGAAGPNHHRRPLRSTWFGAPAPAASSLGACAGTCLRGVRGRSPPMPRSGRGTVRYGRIHRPHLPVATAPRGARCRWSPGRQRPALVRRSTARVETVGMAGTSSRAPAPVSHEAPCGDSVSLPRPAARQEAGAWLTCWRRCIPITFSSHGASVQAPDPAARPRSRSYHHSGPLARPMQGSGPAMPKESIACLVALPPENRAIWRRTG